LNNLFDDYKLIIQLNFAHVPTKHVHIFKSIFLRDHIFVNQDDDNYSMVLVFSCRL